MATKAKTGEFKNKITKAQEDLFKALDQEKLKRTQTSSKIVQELTKAGKANIKTLTSLNKEYLDHCLKNDQELLTFTDKVKQINDDLDLAIKTYNETYNVDNEQAKLIEAKDKVVAPLKTRCKREIHDINIRIDRIDKELKETLEDRNLKLETDSNDYKEKLIDFEKRKRFDINKIQNNTIKAYDELQKKLLVENKRSEIKKHKKAIKEIRYEGLSQEKECLLKYADDQEAYELDYLKNEYEELLKNSELEKDYNTRIENTKFDRSMIELNFQKEFDRYDNEAIHNLNIVNKDMEYKQNAMKEIQYKNIYEATINEFNNEQKKHDDELKTVTNIYDNILKLDSKQIDTIINLDQKDLNSINNDIKLFSKNITLTLNFYVTQIINIYHAYFKDLFHKEENFITLLVSTNISGDFLNGYNMENDINNISIMFNKFKDLETEAITNFETILNNLLNNLLTQVEVFIEGINNISLEIHNQVINYHNEMTNLLNTNKDNALAFYTNIYNEKGQNIKTKLEDNQKLFDERNITLENDRKNYDEEFILREDKVKQVESEEALKYKDILKGFEETRNTNINLINEKYNEEIAAKKIAYDEKCQKVNEKFANERVQVEQDYKVKMGLL